MRNILFIDDDVMMQDIVSQALVSSGYDVEIAGNGQEGIKKFEKGFYDLVITDIFMPGLDGNKVAIHIRNSKRQQTPIIAVSGTPWHLDGWLFDDILVKPFTIKALLKSIDHLQYVPDGHAVSAI
jgi:CheY-like chemotaxis protein